MIETMNDVSVKISILHPAPLVGLGRPAIFVSGVSESYKEYSTLSAVKENYPESTTTYQKARAIFRQVNAPDTIAVITHTGNIAKAAEQFFLKPWHFALLADYDQADALELAKFIEQQEYKFLVVQVPTTTTAFSGKNLTIVAVHNVSDEHLDAAVIGNAASLTVGSVTWKGRPRLVGVTPRNLKVAELENIHTNGGFAYVEKAGVPQTSEGKTAAGEFIDALHGDHWVKSTIEARLQHLLSNSDKIEFNAHGIALLQSEVISVLDEAFANGIVDMDDETGAANYSVNALQRDALNPADIGRRNYRGLSFNYKRSGAIHSVNVIGEIEV